MIGAKKKLLTEDATNGSAEIPTWQAGYSNSGGYPEPHRYYENPQDSPDAILLHDPEGPEDFVVSGGRWWDANGTASGSFTTSPGGSGGVVAWSLTGAGVSDQTGADFFSGLSVDLSSFLNFDFQAELRRAFDAWSAVANIEFIQVVDGGGNHGVGGNPTIRISGGFIDGSSNVLASAFFPTSNVAGGDLVFDSGETTFWTPQRFFLVAMHEIGHTLGLDHEPAPPNGATAVMNPFFNATLTGLQPDDINGARNIYGSQDFGPNNYFMRAGQANLTLIDGAPALAVFGNNLDNLIVGSNAGEGLNGASGNDTLNGLAGLDTLVGGSGNDRMDGGQDNDRLFGGLGTDQLEGGDADDQLFGEEGNDELRGGAGNDFLDGQEGDDQLWGFFGSDTMLGGTGNDRIDGEQDNDFLFGWFGNDTLFGGEGDDRIDGEDGNDTLWGFFGNDQMFGGAGDDFMDGANGDDRMFGEDQNDVMLGGAGADFIDGQNGSDSLFGWFGNDTMLGGGNNDRMDGEQDDDSLFGWFGDDTLFGGEGQDRLHGEQNNDVLWGFFGSDVLFGGDGNDTLNGEDGNDNLIGGRGNDTMNGGAGIDNYFFADFEIAAGEVDLIAAYDLADRYGFQNTLNGAVSYLDTAPGAAIIVGVAGGVFRLDVSGASVEQLQAQTDFFSI